METNNKGAINYLNYIAGGLWIVFLLAEIISFGFHFSLTLLFFYVSCILFAVGNITKIKPVLLAGAGAMIANTVFICFNNVKMLFTTDLPPSFMVKQISLYIFMTLAYALALMCILQLNTKKSMKNIWIVSIVIMVVKYIAAGYFTFAGVLCFILEVVALALTLLWIDKNSVASDEINSSDKKYDNQIKRSKIMYNEQTETSSNSQFANAYQEMVIHIILLLVTCGIWYYVWVYRFTGYTNGMSDEQDRNPTNQLLLCLFIPFYYLYWMYQTACRMEKISAKYDVTCESPILYVICALLVGIIPPILMQYRMNEIAQKAGNVNYTDTSYNQNPEPVQTPVIEPKKNVVNIKKDTENKVLQDKTAIQIAEEINKYKKLRDSEIITDEEFEAKKKQILGL